MGDYAGDRGFVESRAAWGSGDYAVVGTTLQIVGETLCEAVDLRSGQRVLDVAAGNGNATLAAARRFADVVSTDYVGALLERGLVKVQNFRNSSNKLAYAYYLTPKGAREKIRTTAGFLKRKLAEYEAMQKEIEELKREVKADGIH